MWYWVVRSYKRKATGTETERKMIRQRPWEVRFGLIMRAEIDPIVSKKMDDQRSRKTSMVSPDYLADSFFVFSPGSRWLCFKVLLLIERITFSAINHAFEGRQVC